MKSTFSKILLCVFMALFYATFVGAETLTESMVTKVALSPKSIDDTNFEDGKFKVIFDLLYKTKNANFKLDSVKILDSTDVTSTNVVSNFKNNEYLIEQQYQATIDHDYDLKSYPFDSQTFVIALEVPESNSVRSYFDTKNNAIMPELQIDNWSFVKYEVTESIITHNMTLGDTSYTSSPYNLISFEYGFKHKDWRTYINLFSAFFICAIFLLLAFFFEDFEIKFQLILAAIFGFIGNKYIVDSTIPVSASFTLSDSIQLSTFLAILLCALGVFIEKKISEESKLKTRIACAVLISTAYFSSIIYFTVSAMKS